MFSFYFSKSKYIIIHLTYVYTPSNIFRAYVVLIVKLEHNFQNYMTYKTKHMISNYRVGMLTNPINPMPKPNSSSGVASKQTLIDMINACGSGFGG